MAGIVKANLLCHRPADVVAYQCIKPAFFPPISDLMPLVCHKCSVLVPWVWAGTHPSLGLKVQEVSAQHCSPVKGWWISWSAELSAWWPPLWSQGKSWDSKTFQSNLFIPAHSQEPLSSCFQELFFWSWFGNPLAEGEALMASPKHTGGLGTEQFVSSSLGRIVMLLFFKCCVVHVHCPLQAELNFQKADLCWIPLCPHYGLYWVLVFLPCDFYP